MAAGVIVGSRLLWPGWLWGAQEGLSLQGWAWLLTAPWFSSSPSFPRQRCHIFLPCCPEILPICFVMMGTEASQKLIRAGGRVSWDSSERHKGVCGVSECCSEGGEPGPPGEAGWLWRQQRAPWAWHWL